MKLIDQISFDLDLEAEKNKGLTDADITRKLAALTRHLTRIARQLGLTVNGLED